MKKKNNIWQKSKLKRKDLSLESREGLIAPLIRAGIETLSAIKDIILKTQCKLRKTFFLWFIKLFFALAKNLIVQIIEKITA